MREQRFDADAFSYVAQDQLTIAINAAQDQKYGKAAEDVRGSVVSSVDGVTHKE